MLFHCQICHLIRGGVQEQYIPEQKVPYFVMGDEWVGFDNLRSVREKVRIKRVDLKKNECLHGINDKYDINQKLF